MIVSLLHIVWYCKFCEESQYYDFADISAFALHRNFYGYFRSQICRLMSALMNLRIYLMILFLKTLLTKDSTEGYIDSTKIDVCHLKRSKLNCWKISGWILVNGYGFKLHLVIDINGNIINATILPGNESDIRPVEKLLKNFKGAIFGDKGYISKKLFENLLNSKISNEDQEIWYGVKKSC